MTSRNNICIPDDLLDQAQHIAKSEGRSADELAADALRRYIEIRRDVQELRELASWGERHAQERGFKPSDVDRAISDIRRNR